MNDLYVYCCLAIKYNKTESAELIRTNKLVKLNQKIGVIVQNLQNAMNEKLKQLREMEMLKKT